MSVTSRALVAAFLAGCGGSSSRIQDAREPLDLRATLAPDQVRAGIVGDERAFWGGISAEAQRGDVKIYNARVRFAIQAPRDGSYYIRQGGHVIDADIVRPVGQPGADMVDEWVGMAGLGRMIEPHTIEIVDSGRDGVAAVVRVSGGESPLELLEGAVEAPGALVPDLGLQITHTYRLEPDRYLLEVTTEVSATDTAASFNPGDAIMGAFDAADWWGPGRGYLGADNVGRGWNGYVGQRNEAAFGLFSSDGAPLGTAGLQALSELLDAAAGFANEPTVLQPGQSASWTRFYGVGPDFATLTDEWMERTGQASQTVTGVVQGPDGPVAGARVVVFVDDEPWTMAFTAVDGSWSADVPQGATTRQVVDGRGPGTFFDLPEGAPLYGPYTARPVRDDTLEALASGAVPIPLAEALGAAEGDGLLGRPARVRVTDSDRLPLEVRLRRLDPEPEVDERAVRPRPSWTVAGWTADGEIELLAEPGTYQLIVHRGPRFERWVDEVVLVAGQTLNQPVLLEKAYDHEGWIWADPHVHGSPSADTDVPMTHRMLNMAGAGLQLHFGTDHDHIADYTVLLEPLGLSGHMNSVVATEMSPVMRGHLNLYPLRARTDVSNGGAWPWWSTPIEDTDDQMARLRERLGGPLHERSGFVIQSNHPMSGLMSFANWSPGEIGKPDFYSADVDAIEVLNSGGWEDHLQPYLDLTPRGAELTPVGVSDSHSLFGGSPGFNGTWIGLGTDDPAEYTDDALREAFLAHRTIPALGLFLDLSIPPGSTVVGSAVLDVAALGPSWIHADRLHLYRDGVRIETVESDRAQFTLEPDRDAVYVVMAEGDTSMAPISNERPWALSAGIRVDVDGDGWTPPLAPLVLGAR